MFAIPFNKQTVGLGAVVLLAAAITLYLLLRNSRWVGATIGRAAVDLPTGAVLGIGDSLGIPRTDEDECAKALREGRKWDASFACSASKFLGSIFSSGGTQAPSQGVLADVYATPPYFPAVPESDYTPPENLMYQITGGAVMP